MATGNPRNKCALKPGHSLMDWVRLGNSNCDLAGTKGEIRSVSYELLAKHNKVDDAWLAIRGKVYNVTRYMDFHPGGVEELMKGVGKDATKIFDNVHAWVNYEQLLHKCYIGPLHGRLTISLDISGNSSTTKSINQLACSTTPNGCFKAPFLPIFSTASDTKFALRSPSTSTLEAGTQSQEIIPRFDWIQKTNELSLVFYTRSMCNPGMVISCAADSQSKINIGIQIQQTIHIYDFYLADQVEWPPLIANVNQETGKIECIFKKRLPALWTNFGLLNRQKLTDLSNCTHLYDVIERAQITHDSYAIALKPKQSILQIPPIGYHINVTANVEGSKITRSYTPVPKSYAPISCNTNVDVDPCIYLLIKAYRDGALSRYITNNLGLASDLEISHAKGSFDLNQIKKHNRLAILAAGSGITPMLEIINYLLERTSNKPERINLLYFNKTVEDIWCRKNLDDLVQKNERLQVKYILSEPRLHDWIGETGRMTIDIAKSLFKSDSAYHSEYCLVCGPLPFNELCEETLHLVGYKDDCIHYFGG